MNIVENVSLFHGTSVNEFERIKAAGYQVVDFYLGESVDNICLHYAEQKARQDGSDPVIIAVDGGKLHDLRNDIHGEADNQLGQFIFSGDLSPAILRAYRIDEDGDEVELEV